MLVSASILGLTEETLKIAQAFKSKQGYGIDFRIQCIQVEDTKNYPTLITHRKYQVVGRETEDWIAALKDDSYEIDHMMIPISDDINWLKESDGHDTIIISKTLPEWKDAIDYLKTKGHWVLDLETLPVETAITTILSELEVRRKRGNGSQV